MSLSNATLLRVDGPESIDAGGERVPAAPGPALSVRCILSEPTSVVRWLIADLELDATAVLYVRNSDWPDAGRQLVRLSRALVRLDGDPAAQLLSVQHVTHRVFGGLSHVQALVREAT